MPGIAGIITHLPQGDESAKVDLMLKATLHEPFYTHGTYTNGNLGVFLAYSALPGSFADGMPFWNEERTVAAFLTGECYTDDASGAGAGHFLPAQYQAHPDRFFSQLNGWIHGAIVDFGEEKITLFTDRCGLRRLYYCQTEQAFYFASEAKSLLAVLPHTRQLLPDSVAQYLTYDCVLENRTFFRDINLLPPASAWEFQHQRLRKKTYFDWSAYASQPPLPPAAFERTLGETFERIQPRYFRGQAVGMALTGGLDGRMIVAAKRPLPGELPCYTFASNARDTLDVRIARRVAQAAGQAHQTLHFDVRALLEEYSARLRRALYISDGLSWVDTVELTGFMSGAREVAPVAMTGKFGSQMMRGLLGLKKNLPCQGFIHGDFQGHVRHAEQMALQFDQTSALMFMLTKAIPWWWSGYVCIESSQLTVRSPYLDNDLVQVLFQAPSRTLRSCAMSQLRFIQKRAPELASIPTDRGWLLSNKDRIGETTRFLLGAINLANRVYCHERFPYPLPQAVNLFDSWLAPLGVARLFNHVRFSNYRIWFRDQLSTYLQDTLTGPSAVNRPYWDGQFLRRCVADHAQGRANHLREIKKALHLEVLHQVLLERKWPAAAPYAGGAIAS